MYFFGRGLVLSFSKFLFCCLGRSEARKDIKNERRKEKKKKKKKKEKRKKKKIDLGTKISVRCSKFTETNKND